MTLTIGRIDLSASTGIYNIEWRGDSFRFAVDIEGVTPQTALAIRQQVLGLQAGDEIPFVWSDDEGLSGIYRVDRLVRVQPVAVYLVEGFMACEFNLTRLGGGFATPSLEAVFDITVPPNDHSVVAAGADWVAGFPTVNGLTGATDDTTVVGGNATVPSRSYSGRVLVERIMANAATIRTSESAGLPVVGTQARDVQISDGGWVEVDNGFVTARFSENTSIGGTTVELTGTTVTGVGTATARVFSTSGISPTFEFASIAKNTPQEVVVSLDFQSGLAETMDVRLRRGSQMVECQLVGFATSTIQVEYTALTNGTMAVDSDYSIAQSAADSDMSSSRWRAATRTGRDQSGTKIEPVLFGETEGHFVIGHGERDECFTNVSGFERFVR